MSLDEVKKKTSASQFILWMEFLDWEINAFDVSNYYMAQIAAEIRRSYAKRNSKISVDDFIMKFKHKKEVRPQPIEARTSKIKSFFFRLTGISDKGK